MLPQKLAAEYSLKGLWLALVALVVTVALGFSVIQTARLEGFKFWPISVQGWKPRALSAEATLAKVAAAQVVAKQVQEQVNQTAEQDYAEIAERIDRETIEELETELASAERYIRNNRVRPQANRCVASGAGSTAPDNGPAHSEGASEAPLLDGEVRVLEEDVRICTTNTLKAEAGHRFATELENASRND